MDNLTHGLTGALMGQAGLKKKTGLAMAALIFGANLPDIDVVSMLWLDGKETLGFRRGITHGPIGVVLLPLGLAALLWLFDRWQVKRGKRPGARLPVSFKWLYILGLIGAISHVLMDWLNVYGVRFLYPFDKSWYYGDTLFIIDVWLWALLGFSVWFSLRREKREGEWKRPAWIGIAAGLAYIGANWMITGVNETATKGREPYPQATIASPPPFASWEREAIIKTAGGKWLSNSWTGAEWGYGYFEPDSTFCKVPGDAAEYSSDAEAFLIWSRAPFATQADDGSVVLYDARFYDPRARDRFSVALPDVKCEPPAHDPTE